MAPLQNFITYAAIVTIAGQIVFLSNFFWSLFRGVRSESNPWSCTTLEWTLPSPAPAEGFSQPPVVNHGPYEYAENGQEPNFIMQDAPTT
jgi:cytochrome c oxidase subunit 1